MHLCQQNKKEKNDFIMASVSRLEKIVSLITAKQTKQSYDAAWKVLRSESAKAESEIITLSSNTEREIIEIIKSIKSKKLENYDTSKYLDEIKKTLSIMLGNCDAAARRMVTANILAGKVKDKTTSTNVILTELDQERIDRMTKEVVGRIQKGVSLTLESIKNMLNSASIKANMKNTQEQNETTEKNETIATQTPINSTAMYNNLESKRSQKQYREVPLTKEEIKALKENPIAVANKQAKENVTYVQKLHKQYLKQKNRVHSNKKHNNTGLSQAEITSNSINEALDKDGIFAFSDKSGRRWSLVNYCSMVTRTTASQSTNLGEVFANEEHDLYYIVPHSGSCPLCKKYEGKVYSRSGKNKNYPPLSMAFSKINPNGKDDLENTYFTIHPNCRHKVIKYFENKQTPKQKKDMMFLSNTPNGLTKKQLKQVRDAKENERRWNEQAFLIREKIKNS